jgi:hypothetical protein
MIARSLPRHPSAIGIDDALDISVKTSFPTMSRDGQRHVRCDFARTLLDPGRADRLRICDRP